MTNSDENAPKVHYICQTYIEKTAGPGVQPGLKIGKQFQYTNAAQAQDRAEREANSDDCAGADAYMITEDPSSGEVSAPSFLVRLGNVPETDDF